MNETDTSLSETLKECKNRIEKLVRQNEMLINDLVRKDCIINEQNKEN